MSSNVKKKLLSHCREPASLFTVFQPCQHLRIPAPLRSTAGSIPKRNFSWNGTKPRLQPQSRVTVKSFASGGLLLFGINPETSIAHSAVSSCGAVLQKSLYTTSWSSRPSIISLASKGWRREIHTSGRRKGRIIAKRNKSSTSKEHNGQNAPKSTPVVKMPEPPPETHSYLHMPQMPKLPHRPTKEELLAAATGFWSRLKVRFKWFSIRSSRPWNIDDWSAFVSWFVLGNIVWMLVGTTTFLSLVIFTINTVFAQGMFLYDYLMLFILMKHIRNFGKMDRRLSDPFCWSEGRLRICGST
jgi:distribution and morphology protein 31